jgi:hypothetical protein
LSKMNKRGEDDARPVGVEVCALAAGVRGIDSILVPLRGALLR